MDCSVSICESTRISRVSRTPSGNEKSMTLRKHQRSETALAPLLRFRDGSFTGTISSSEFQLVDKGHSRMATSGRSSSVTMLASASSLDRLIGLRRGRLGRVWSFPSPNFASRCWTSEPHMTSAMTGNSRKSSQMREKVRRLSGLLHQHAHNRCSRWLGLTTLGKAASGGRSPFSTSSRSPADEFCGVIARTAFASN